MQKCDQCQSFQGLRRYPARQSVNLCFSAQCYVHMLKIIFKLHYLSSHLHNDYYYPAAYTNSRGHCHNYMNGTHK